MPTSESEQLPAALLQNLQEGGGVAENKTHSCTNDTPPPPPSIPAYCFFYCSLAHWTEVRAPRSVPMFKEGGRAAARHKDGRVN